MNHKFIVPTLIENSESAVVSHGLLFKLPADLGGAAKILSYAQKEKIGWHKIDHGYWMFVHQSDVLGLVRFIGLSPSDTKPTKNLGVVHPFTRSEFERYVESVVDAERQFRHRVQDELSLLIHDLRRISNSIYQNAVATKKAIREGNGADAAVRIENTIAAQAMLSIRTDILDMTEIRDIQLDESKVHAYRKFDKVVKSFQPASALRNVDLIISGTSHSRVLGPDCMEIIAYILIDNALKYSPYNNEITVKFDEDESFISARVTSLGPKIKPEERDSIFEKGFRSKGAQSIDVSGTGYGLYLARSLVDRFKGLIGVEQDTKEVMTSRGACFDTTFFLRFPIYEKLYTPVYVNNDEKDLSRSMTSPKVNNPPRKATGATDCSGTKRTQGQQRNKFRNRKEKGPN